MELKASDIAGQVSSRAFDLGREYHRAGRVTEARVRAVDGATILTGRVRGSSDNIYNVYIEASTTPSGELALDGDCSCPVGYNCKHVVAVLLEAGAGPPCGDASSAPVKALKGDPRLRQWLDQVALARDAGTVEPALRSSERLLYLLDPPVPATPEPILPVRLVTCRLLKSGAYGKPTPFSVQRTWQAHPARVLQGVDIETLRLAGPPDSPDDGDSVHLHGESGGRLLEAILGTGRCHWGDPSGPLLALGEPRPATFQWDEDENGRQRLAMHTDPPSPLVLPLCPPWYLDLQQGSCAPLQTTIEPHLATLVTRAPSIEPGHAQALPPDLAALLDELDLPRPRIRSMRDIKEIPRPCLRLLASDIAPFVPTAGHWWTSPVRRPCRARLTFEYAGHELGAADRHDSCEVIRVGNGLIRIHRDEDAEAAAVETLFGHGLEPMPTGIRPGAGDHEPGMELAMAPAEDGSRVAWLDFLRDGAPRLREQEWRIDVAEDFDHRLLVPQDWTASLEENEREGWFGLELGLTVEGETVSLLPILHELLSGSGGRSVHASIAGLDDDDDFLVRRGDAWLCLPVARIRAILDTLVELSDPQLGLDDGSLRLPTLRAAEIEELDQRVGGVHWREGDARRLAALGERVRAFTGARPQSAPDGFAAVLRPYQERGLGWLQALRELGLGGILADDMGLGKTVQALAHLMVEKLAGRMQHPCLVVAPTSVIANWASEAQRFAPQLRVLLLQGGERHEGFRIIDDHDLVITSYALVRRDHDRLAECSFHCLILDEAQAVKNPRTKTRQLLRSLRAKQRLCLTGTPLENHLGELWSLVDFLEPGLLGDARQFSRLFRRPIEQAGDAERRSVLARRISPLLLRRGKEEIDDELPDKVEITRLIDLLPQQQDLYETIRVAMQEKVQRALVEHGFERSRIVVLDALLKLRQICCDPRLVKLEAARKVQASAKLDHLMELLVEMIDEGRQVLLFSQFTSMLGLIEPRLRAAGIDFTALTGNTRDRVTPVERFQSGAVRVFLISLKAGGTGLNLTAADTVIHYDPWWNPAVESQAADRAHRIGQDKKVFVYKLITAGTVESRIVALQARKRQLVDSILHDAGSVGRSDLSAEDLQNLLRPLD